ncbi:MAG: methyltransferase domain-containing protein [bacterium]|nr:methyltransferase domain-containing protein [bacterium]
MSSLVFILGREPELSVAEIAAVLPDATWAGAELSAEALVVPLASTPPLPTRGPGQVAPPLEGGEKQWGWERTLIRRLGGTIKIGEVWREVPHDGFDGQDDAIGKFILEHTSDVRKTHFGYSVYDLGGGVKRTMMIRQSLTRGAAAQKVWLQEHGRKVRGVTSREATLSSVIVAKNDLLPERNGVEVLVLVGATHVILAQTLVVQPFEEWGKRDFGRPKRDARSGMLPPKLARMMLNIGAASRQPQAASFSLLDPFCGSGTILTEAMVLGVSRIIGTDMSAVAIRDATANAAWMGNQLPSTHEVTISECDVRRLSQCVRERVDAIVTEPYLGPPHPSPRSIPLLIEELESLYVSAFREFVKVLKPGGRVVFVVPVFSARGGPAVGGQDIRTVAIDRDVERLGFRRVAPFPSPLAQHPILRDVGDLSYARPDQRVGRTILLFERA